MLHDTKVISISVAVMFLVLSALSFALLFTLTATVTQWELVRCYGWQCPACRLLI